MHRRGRRLAVLAPALASLLLVAAVGCGEEGSAEEASRLTRSQLAERMGDICQEHTDRQVIAIERYEKRRGIPLGRAIGAQLERELVEVMLPIVRDTIHDIGRLHPPAGAEEELEAFLEALEHGVEASERDPSWIATGEFEPFMRARETSAALGTYYCGQA